MKFKRYISEDDLKQLKAHHMNLEEIISHSTSDREIDTMDEDFMNTADLNPDYYSSLLLTIEIEE